MFVLLGIARAAVCISFVCCASLPYMSICTRVVVSITFHQVDYAPDTKTGTDCNDQCLKDIDCTAKKSHNQMYEQTLFLMVCKRLALLLSLLFRPFCTLISSSRVLEFFLSYQSSPSSASITDTSSWVTVTSYISNSVSSDIKRIILIEIGKFLVPFVLCDVIFVA